MKRIALKYFVFGRFLSLTAVIVSAFAIQKYIYRKYMRESIPLGPRGHFR